MRLQLPPKLPAEEIERQWREREAWRNSPEGKAFSRKCDKERAEWDKIPTWQLWGYSSKEEYIQAVLNDD